MTLKPVLFFDLEAEQAVLGSLIYRNDLFREVKGFINSLDFYSNTHQLIFQAMDSLSEEDAPLDEILIGDQLIAMEKLSEAGGRPYLAELIDFVPSSGNVVHYAKIVQEHSAKRGLYLLLDGELKGLQKGSSVQESLHKILQHSEVVSQGQGFNPVLLKDCAKNFFEKLEEITKNNKPLGLLTGFPELDQLLMSLEDGDFCIIAGRPSMGKTAFALNLSHNFAKNFGTGLFISLEMTKEQLYGRFISSETKIPSEKFKTGQIKDKDWDLITLGMDELGTLPLYIEDQDLPLDQLIFGIENLHKKDTLSFLIVDYLQLMDANKGNGRTEEIEHISLSLKKLAKKLNIPVIALAQLNRNLENRSDKRPTMADLKGSGAIEQDADQVLFIYREVVYNANTHKKNIAEIIIGKNRHGPTGFIELKFKGETTTFISEHEKRRHT